MENKKGGLPAQAGFIKIIIIVIIALLLMRHFGLTFTKILTYFNLTWMEVLGWIKHSFVWFKDLFNSVK